MDIKKEREAFEPLQNQKALARLYFVDELNMYLTSDNYADDDFTISLCMEINHGWKMWQAAKSQAVPECVWVERYDGSVFESSCGHTFELSNDGKLDDNNMKHCCFCGGKIEAQEQSND